MSNNNFPGHFLTWIGEKCGAISPWLSASYSQHLGLHFIGIKNINPSAIQSWIIRLHLLTSIICMMSDWPLQIYFNFQLQSIFLKTNCRFNSIIKIFWHLTVVLQRFGTFWKSKMKICSKVDLFIFIFCGKWLSSQNVSKSDDYSDTQFFLFY